MTEEDKKGGETSLEGSSPVEDALAQDPEAGEKAESHALEGFAEKDAKNGEKEDAKDGDEEEVDGEGVHAEVAAVKDKAVIAGDGADAEEDVSEEEVEAATEAEQQLNHSEAAASEVATEAEVATGAEPEQVVAAEGETEGDVLELEAEVAEAEPEAEAAVTEPEAEAAVAEPEGEAAVAEPEAEATVAEPEGEAAVAEPETEAAVAEPEARAAVAEPEAGAAVAEPEAGAAVAEPEVEVVEDNDDDDDDLEAVIPGRRRRASDDGLADADADDGEFHDAESATGSQADEEDGEETEEEDGEEEEEDSVEEEVSAAGNWGDEEVEQEGKEVVRGEDLDAEAQLDTKPAPFVRRQPFQVPTSGAFWLHDDRFDEEVADADPKAKAEAKESEKSKEPSKDGGKWLHDRFGREDEGDGEEDSFSRGKQFGGGRSYGGRSGSRGYGDRGEGGSYGGRDDGGYRGRGEGGGYRGRGEGGGYDGRGEGGGYRGRASGGGYGSGAADPEGERYVQPTPAPAPASCGLPTPAPAPSSMHAPAPRSTPAPAPTPAPVPVPDDPAGLDADDKPVPQNSRGKAALSNREGEEPAQQYPSGDRGGRMGRGRGPPEQGRGRGYGEDNYNVGRGGRGGYGRGGRSGDYVEDSYEGGRGGRGGYGRGGRDGEGTYEGGRGGRGSYTPMEGGRGYGRGGRNNYEKDATPAQDGGRDGRGYGRGGRGSYVDDATQEGGRGGRGRGADSFANGYGNDGEEIEPSYSSGGRHGGRGQGRGVSTGRFDESGNYAAVDSSATDRKQDYGAANRNDYGSQGRGRADRGRGESTANGASPTDWPALPPQGQTYNNSDSAAGGGRGGPRRYTQQRAMQSGGQEEGSGQAAPAAAAAPAAELASAPAPTSAPAPAAAAQCSPAPARPQKGSEGGDKLSVTAPEYQPRSTAAAYSKQNQQWQDQSASSRPVTSSTASADPATATANLGGGYQVTGSEVTALMSLIGNLIDPQKQKVQPDQATQQLNEAAASWMQGAIQSSMQLGNTPVQAFAAVKDYVVQQQMQLNQAPPGQYSQHGGMTQPSSSSPIMQYNTGGSPGYGAQYQGMSMQQPMYTQYAQPGMSMPPQQYGHQGQQMYMGSHGYQQGGPPYQQR